MRLFNKTVIVAAMALTMAGSADLYAKNKCVPKLYAFGFAASFNDSIVHLTDIQEIDSAWINDKNKFLIGRENYSYQLRNYLERQGLAHRTCFISFALKRKDVQKKYNKLRSKYVKRGITNIKNINSNEFHFTAIKPEE